MNIHRCRNLLLTALDNRGISIKTIIMFFLYFLFIFISLIITYAFNQNTSLPVNRYQVTNKINIAL
jgi:phosphate starvation-inducible membrane PsiE